MSETRTLPLTWWEQDEKTRREAEALKSEILNKFWEIRVENAKENYSGPLRGFLEGNPPEGLNTNEWAKVLDGKLTHKDYEYTFDQIFDKNNKDFDMKKNKDAFMHYFSHVKPVKVLKIDEGEGFNIAKSKKLTTDVIVVSDIPAPVTEREKKTIENYLADSKMSAVASIAAQGSDVTVCSSGNTANSIFSTHSVTKIFTGALVMIFLEKGILKPEDLDRIININPDLMARLAKSHGNITDRLKEVTLHEVMTHHAGFRDYMPDYVAAVNSDKKPDIQSISDFVTYAENSVSDSYKKDKPASYSNLGTLFVGLALEQAYERYRKDPDHQSENLPALDFFGLVSEFIQQPAGMTHLSKSAPEGAKVNLSTTIKDGEPTPEAPYLVASPSGGLWTSAEDLRKFGEWLHGKCIQPGEETSFMKYMKEFGEEFYNSKTNTIEHPGENPSASAMLSVSLKTGTVIATLSNSSRSDAQDLEAAIKRNVFSKTMDLENVDEKSKTMKIVLLLGPSSAGKSTLCDELQSDHQWEVVSSDAVRDKMRFNVDEDLKKELNAEGLISQLSEFNMTEDEVVQFCQDGQLKISKNGHEVEYIVRNLSMPDIEEVLSNAGFAENEVLSLSKTLRDVGKVYGRFYSNERLDGILLDEVFKKHDEDASIIIDTVPEGAKSLIASLNERADKYRKENGEDSLDTSIVLAHITPQKLSERVQVRNEKAEKSQNLRNKREGMFPFQQLGSVVAAKDASAPASSQTLGTVSNPELLKISYRHNPYKPREKKSFQRAARASVEYVRLSKKMGLPRDKTAQAELSARGDFKFDAMIDMSEGNPKELASKLLSTIKLKSLMDKAENPGISAASFNTKEKLPSIIPYVQGNDHKKLDNPLTAETVLRVASLSKPVFAYLVLKLIEDNKEGKAKPGLGKFNLPDGSKFDLDTPLYEVLSEEAFKKFTAKFSSDDETQKKARELTARHVLSHTTGLPGHMREDVPLKFTFKPGEEFGYSNPAISLLQDVVEAVTGSNLESLAQHNVFRAIPGMEKSTFLPPDLKDADIDVQLKEMKAENSLHTTPTEYAHFFAEWMRNPVLRDMAFDKPVSMEKDKWAAGQGLSADDLKHVAWGNGVGLEKNDKGDVIRVFHWGDMNEWRAFVGYDLAKNDGMVYIANSKAGLMLLDDVNNLVLPDVDFKAAKEYIFKKLGFQRTYEPGWPEKENDRICKIIVKYELDKTELVDKGLLSIEDNKEQHTLAIKCDADYSIFSKVIYNEFQDFKEKKGLSDADNPPAITVKADRDANGNILTLQIHIRDEGVYNQFIERLNADKLLPSHAGILQIDPVLPSQIKVQSAPEKSTTDSVASAKVGDARKSELSSSAMLCSKLGVTKTSKDAHVVVDDESKSKPVPERLDEKQNPETVVKQKVESEKSEPAEKSKSSHKPDQNPLKTTFKRQ